MPRIKTKGEEAVGLPRLQTVDTLREGRVFAQPVAAMKRELLEELLTSVKQARAIEHGERKPARSFNIKPATDITKVWGKLGLSQSEFAAILGISADTLQNWEQGRRQPTGPAKVLLKIAVRHPEMLLEVA